MKIGLPMDIQREFTWLSAVFVIMERAFMVPTTGNTANGLDLFIHSLMHYKQPRKQKLM